MTSVMGWAADKNGCGYYRMGLPLTAMVHAGHEAVISTLLNHWTKPEEPDVWVGQRICAEGPTFNWQHYAGTAARVVEIDDDLWSVDPSNPSYDEYPADIQVNLANNMRLADLITVSTDYLANVVSHYNPNVVVLPNQIDAKLLARKRRKFPSDDVVVGWAGGGSHLVDMTAHHYGINQALSIPGISVHMIGQDYRYDLGLKGARHTPWSDEITRYYGQLDFDIALAPLRDTHFNRSKSDIKVLEAAALGIPSVASNVGPYSNAIVHGETGFLVNKQSDWSKYVSLLVNDEDLRLKMGQAAKAWAATRTIQGNVHLWVDAYASVTHA